MSRNYTPPTAPTKGPPPPKPGEAITKKKIEFRVVAVVSSSHEQALWEAISNAAFVVRGADIIEVARRSIPIFTESNQQK